MVDPQWKDALHTNVRIRLSFWDWCKALFGTVCVHTRYDSAEVLPLGRTTETEVWIAWRPTWWPFKPKPMSFTAPDTAPSHSAETPEESC